MKEVRHEGARASEVRSTQIRPTKVRSQGHPTLLFDLDGTLTDPREGITRSIAHALRVLDRPVPGLEELTRWIGPPLAHVFGSLLSTDDPEILRAAIAAYRERFASVGILENRVQPGIREALAALMAERAATLFIVTSKPRTYAERIVEHFDLAKYFQVVHGPDLDDLRAYKPLLIRELIESYGIECARAAVIGDRRDDIQGAKANGLISIGVTWGFGSREELSDADQIIDSPAELIGALRGR